MSKNLESIIIATRVDDLSVAETIEEIATFIQEQCIAILEGEKTAVMQDRYWELRVLGMGRMAEVLGRRLDKLTDLVATDNQSQVESLKSAQRNDKGEI